jgi:hypothetical protein
MDTDAWSRRTRGFFTGHIEGGRQSAAALAAPYERLEHTTSRREIGPKTFECRHHAHG